MVNVNDFKGKNDSETIENAIIGRGKDGIVIIPPRISDIEPERDWWLLDRAILLPENTLVIMQNCKIKLSDKCRDNFFRTANCGIGISYPKEIKNVHIKGEGLCVLEGADRPRATGDNEKILACPCPYEIDDLCRFADWISEEDKKTGEIKFADRHNHSFGTDAGKEDESQYGDWRGIGILFANITEFSIENVKIVNSHGWGISMEACSYGRIEKIEFDACMSKEIDGMRQNMENQDGIDIRNGCHDILINDITGRTGDDVIALTAIDDGEVCPGGELKRTRVMHSDWTKRDKNIHNIIIRNVAAQSHLCCIVRLLPVNTKIWNVTIDGVIDTALESVGHFGCILLGSSDMIYGTNLRESIKNITISNVISNARDAIIVDGYICDSVITNVVNRNENSPAISVKRKDGMTNVKTENIFSASGIITQYKQ